MLARKNNIGFWMLLPLTVLSLAHFCWASYNTLLIGFADIDVFLYSVLHYLHEGILYQDREPLALTYEAGRSVLKFPPLYVVPYLPWLHVDPVIQNGINPHTYHFLFALHVLRYIATFFLLGFFIGPSKHPLWWMLLVILFALCAPFYEALYGLTFDSLYLFILALSLVLLKYRQPLFAATLLMYAANAKLYPFLQVVQFAASRNWKMLFYCGIATVFWIGCSLYFFSFAQHEFYYFKVIPVLLKEDILCETGNLSLAALFCRFSFLAVIFKIVFILATFVICFIAMNKGRASFERESLLFALVICLPLLIMQNVWGNYQIVLLIPICILVAHAFNAGDSVTGKIPAVLAVLAWLPLIVSDNYPAMNMPYYAWFDDRLLRFMIDVLKPLSVLLLWFTLSILLLFSKKVAR